MKTYIVTGGAGFIGSNIVKRLISQGDKVYVLDDLLTGFEHNLDGKAIFYNVDISDYSKIEALDFGDKIDAVYHIAAQPSGEASFEDPARDIDVNFKATYNVLRLGELKKAKRFLYASSMSVYGEVSETCKNVSEDYECIPESYYGCNKLASEALINVFAKNNDIETTIFRLFNVYGPGQNMFNMKQGMVSIYMAFLLHDKPIHVKGSLDRFRDFIYVDDIVDAFLVSENNEKTYGGIFNLGTGVKATVKELVAAILKAYDKDDLKKWVYVEGTTRGDTKGCVSDMSKIKETIDWSPRFDIEKGIAEMKKWLDQTRDIWVKNE